MDQRDIEQLYAAGLVTSTINKDDVFMVGRPNSQRGDKYSIFLIGQNDLTIQLRGYKVYTALLTQTGTNNPTVTVLKNELGNIVWTRSGGGTYEATLAGAFPVDKTFGLLTPTTLNTIVSDATSVDVITVTTANHLGAAVDDALLNTPIEIRVYL